MSYFSQKCKKIRVSPTSEIRNLKGHPNFEKSVFLTRCCSNVCMSENLANFYTSGSIKQIKTAGNVSLSKLILKQQNLQTLTAASWQDSMSRGSRVHFFAICRELVKKIIYPTESRGHRPSKRVKSKQS